MPVDVQPPMIVEVEVNSRCNRRCVYCPVSLNPVPSVPRLMRDQVFDRLLDELAGYGFDGRLSYHFYNEPLIRKDLHILAGRARRKLPQAFQQLFTNGDLLTDARYDELVAAGIDKFIVTRHDDSDAPKRERQVVLKGSELQLTNRGGLMFEEGPLDLPCHSPDEMLIVTVTGDVVLCYEDAERKHVLGNIMDQPLREIWEQERLEVWRRQLRAGDRAGATDMCAKCNNRDAAVARR